MLPLYCKYRSLVQIHRFDMRSCPRFCTFLVAASVMLSVVSAFSPIVATTRSLSIARDHASVAPIPTSSTSLHAAIADLDTVALVAGQENYGLAVVLLGEAFWSFGKAPSVDHALKTLAPAFVAAAALAVVSGPMITSGDAGSVTTGLFIATAVSVAMGGIYLARCLASYSPSPKEIPALGVLVALAGFFSFSQNLVVDGFVTLPSIPLPELPSLPSIQLPF